ncbi:MAG: hypothetical protein HY010_16005 [Acidobacteria bacterium]|nr:hypothetical protein [Acidobacteriota bacterium]
MSILRCVAFLCLIQLFGYAQAPQEHGLGLSRQAGVTVRRFYEQLVSDPVEGIPTPKRMKVLSPYLSSALIHRINQARACRDDWFRLHPKNDEKAPSTWFEFGLFSGFDDRGHPYAFQIDKTESEADGSFRVYVRLTEGPAKRPWNWQVAAVVMSRNGQFAIDDVIFLGDENIGTESRLSEVLTTGCDGPHWVANGKNAKP